jgi:hypothetical protein
MCVQVFAFNFLLMTSALIAPPLSRISGSLLTFDRVPDNVPGRFLVSLFTENQRNNHLVGEFE